MPNPCQGPLVIAGAGLESSFHRADIAFEGVDHSGPTYDAHVFLNNALADATTARIHENGYAGAFHVFGHGGCYGDDESHCMIRPRRTYDPRPGPMLAPARKVVIATEAIRRALVTGPDITLTVVPVVRATTPKAPADDALHYERVSIITYR